MKNNLIKKIHSLGLLIVVLATVGILFDACKDENKENVPVAVTGLPTVITSADVEIFALSTTANGEVTLAGKSDVIERGFCFSKISKPTIVDNKIAIGKGLGIFSGSISILEENTTYYYRAYATNTQGTAYGDEVKITTIKLADENTAPTITMNRNAILEDFTGVRCGYCPDGHLRAKAIEDANPGRFIIIGNHSGGYATPAAGWANFTSTGGKAIHDQANPAGYPAGTISRMTCLSLGVNAMDISRSNMTMDRGQWVKAVAKVITLTSPVNIGSRATFNSVTRELTVKVDLYYTGDELVQNNVNVALLQNKLFSKQSGGTPDANNYEQNHVLRYLLTSQWGDIIPAAKTLKGSKYTKTFIYIVPADYNGSIIPPGGGNVVIENCEVVIFVSQNKTNILTGIKIPVTIK